MMLLLLALSSLSLTEARIEIARMPTTLDQIPPLPGCYSVSFQNSSHRPLRVIARYLCNGRWVSSSWQTLQPGDQRCLFCSSNGAFLYRAETIDGGVPVTWESHSHRILTPAERHYDVGEPMEVGLSAPQQRPARLRVLPECGGSFVIPLDTSSS